MTVHLWNSLCFSVFMFHVVVSVKINFNSVCLLVDQFTTSVKAQQLLNGLLENLVHAFIYLWSVCTHQVGFFMYPLGANNTEDVQHDCSLTSTHGNILMLALNSSSAVSKHSISGPSWLYFTLFDQLSLCSILCPELLMKRCLMVVASWATALCCRIILLATVVKKDNDNMNNIWLTGRRSNCGGPCYVTDPTCCPRLFSGCWWTPGSQGTLTWRWRRCASRTPPWCSASAEPPAGWRRRTGRMSTSHPERREWEQGVEERRKGRREET